eukprot:9503122-Pyramimonas_sp.AAC.1
MEGPDPLMDVDGELPAERDDGHGLVFFRVVKMTPSSNKLLRMPAGSRAALRDTHVAVTEHRISRKVNNDTFIIHADSTHNDVALIHSFGTHVNVLEATFTRWAIDPRARYIVEGVSASASDAVTCLVEAGAFHVSDGRVPAPTFNYDNASVAELMAIGAVEEDDSGFYLTERGLNHLQILWQVKQRGLVCDCRHDIPVETFTSYELMKMLEDQGFRWKQLPAKEKDRLALGGYAPDREKMWYSISNAVTPALYKYMICLLSVDRIIADGKYSEIPHYASDGHYLAILEGRDYEQPKFGKKRRHPTLLDHGGMELDGELPLALPARRPRATGGGAKRLKAEA